MRKCTTILLYAAALAASPAQAAPAPSEAPIVVEGELRRDAAVRNYVDALSVAAPGEKIARFEKSICPASLGLSDEMNRQVEQRIRRVAAAANVSAAAEGCAANLLLFVAADKAAFIRQLQKERPLLFGLMTDSQVRALAAQPGGAVTWQLFEQRGADGRTLNNAGARDEGPSTLAGVTSSRLLPQTRTDLDITVVLLEPAAFTGATITQLADYVAMRGLMRSAPQGYAQAAVPTILTLLEDKRLGRPAPMSVTAYDVAYLKALYAMSNSLQAVPQRGELVSRMKTYLAASN